MRAQLERKVFVSSEGTDVEQELVECGAGIDATAVGDGAHTAAQLPERVRRDQRPGRLGVRRSASGWLEEAPRVAEQAAALLRRPSARPA